MDSILETIADVEKKVATTNFILNET